MPMELMGTAAIDTNGWAFHKDAKNRDGVSLTSSVADSSGVNNHHHTLPNLTLHTNGSSKAPSAQSSHAPKTTTASPSLTSGTGQSITSASPTPALTRKGWLSNISSKFTSSHAQNANDLPQTSNPSPERQQPGFLIATLRRFSSPNVSGRKNCNAANGGVCQRVVMNKNLTRDTCKIVELDAVKLKKVAFCVDVEVSAPPPWGKEESTECEKKKKKKDKDKDKEKKDLKNRTSEFERNEAAKAKVDSLDKGGALEVKSDQEVNGQIGASDEKVDEASASENKAFPASSEKTYQRGPDGEILSTLEASKTAQTETGLTAPQESVRKRPTTDASRIYKRCCQLREATMLPRVVEQLANNAGKNFLVSLDLSSYPLHLSDAVVLSDFLALVPITKLDLENCGLSDESLRVILSGLLAVKRQHGKLGKTLPTTCLDNDNNNHEARGVIEWLSLRNNPKLGRDGWRYICKFLHMSRSLKALDVSLIPLPKPAYSPNKTKAQIEACDPSRLLSEALTNRLAGVGLDEFAVNGCGLSSGQIRWIVEGVHKSGTKRLDLARNNINDDGMIYLAKWIKEGNCEGINLSYNDLQEHIDILAASIRDGSNLLALSLDGCNLNAQSLSVLLPALTIPKSFRILDLSHNPLLFSTQPDALPLLRRYLPKMRMLKKLQLADTSMTPDHAIALSEVLPDIKMLAHLNVMENPLLIPGRPLPSQSISTAMEDQDSTAASDSLAISNRQGSQEEGAALYTALVAAVKVSKSIVRLDVDDPGSEAGEVAKALHRKVLAFCLRNLDAGTTDPDVVNGIKPCMLVSNADPVKPVELADEDDDPYEDKIAEKDDYVVGGTGVVKALGVCLGNKAHCFRVSQASGTQSLDSSILLDNEGNGAEKANEMAKALLMRARKIKQRIQPALHRAARGEVEEIHHRKLLFLDDTLYRVISRFEEEYPECKLPPSDPEVLYSKPAVKAPHQVVTEEVEEEDETQIKTTISRKSSDIGLKSKALESEEGEMLKLGTYIQKKIFRNDELISSVGEKEDLNKLEITGRESGSDDEDGLVMISGAEVKEAKQASPLNRISPLLSAEGHSPPSSSSSGPNSPPPSREGTPSPSDIHERIRCMVTELNGEMLRRHVSEQGGADGVISKLVRRI